MKYLHLVSIHTVVLLCAFVAARHASKCCETRRVHVPTPPQDAQGGVQRALHVANSPHRRQLEGWSTTPIVTCFLGPLFSVINSNTLV